jgi:hypothetical protein
MGSTWESLGFIFLLFVNCLVLLITHNLIRKDFGLVGGWRALLAINVIAIIVTFVEIWGYIVIARHRKQNRQSKR